jgi:hypothetical protein
MEKIFGEYGSKGNGHFVKKEKSRLKIGNKKYNLPI